MPSKQITQLPDSVKNNLPKGAQEIYKEAFNSAEDQYGEEDRVFFAEGKCFYTSMEGTGYPPVASPLCGGQRGLPLRQRSGAKRRVGAPRGGPVGAPTQ
jgi:hypothetical protein